LINEQTFVLLGSRCGRNYFDEDTFTIIEYVPLGLNDKTSYPLENRRFIFMIMAIIKLKERCFSAAGIQQENVISHLQCQYCFAEKPKGLRCPSESIKI
jgi:hypothetical protein